MKLAEDLRRAVLQAAIEGSLTGGSRDNWRFVRLGEIGEIIGGGTPNTSKSENWVNGRIAWITPADMGTLKSKYISHGARHITEKGLASSSARIMPKGSIIFSSRAPIGYIAIAENDLCTNQGCKSVKLYDGVLSEYVYFALLAMRDDIKKMGSGTTFKEISGRVFSSVIIPLPPIDEQRRIVSRLDTILPKIAELESAENELEALERRSPGDMRDALLQAAIEGKLTGSNMDNWQWVRLGKVGTFVRGYGIKKSDTTETGKPCIRYGQLYTTFKTSFSEAVSFVPDEIFQRSVKVHKNDILMALTGENNVDIALAVAYTGDEEIAMGGDMTKFMTTIDPMYVVYFMNSPFAISHKSKLATGNIIVHISNDKLASIPLPLPPIEEQHRIVSRLNELLPLCEALEKIT